MSRPRGFTLVELLIAMVIFSIVTVMAYSGLNTILRAEEQLAYNSNRLKNLQRTLFLIGQDLTQVVGRSSRDSFGDLQPPLVANELGLMRMEFTRSGWLNPANLHRSHLQRVGYGVEEDKLIRYHWNFVDRDQGVEPYRSELLTGVTDLKSRFFTQEGEWSGVWPPLKDELQTAMPIGVEITLTLKPEGSVRRLYRLIQYHW